MITLVLNNVRILIFLMILLSDVCRNVLTPTTTMSKIINVSCVHLVVPLALARLTAKDVFWGTICKMVFVLPHVPSSTMPTPAPGDVWSAQAAVLISESTLPTNVSQVVPPVSTQTKLSIAATPVLQLVSPAIRSPTASTVNQTQFPSITSATPIAILLLWLFLLTQRVYILVLTTKLVHPHVLKVLTLLLFIAKYARVNVRHVPSLLQTALTAPAANISTISPV